MTAIYDYYQRLADRRGGKFVFSLAYSIGAPYFASVRPRVVAMQPNFGEVVIKKRRAVQNHIGTVHAIAVANGLEAAMGLLCEATVPAGMRWIPRGITLEYITKVPSDVRCVARTDPQQWAGEPPFAVDVQCTATLADGTEVVTGVIPVWVTASPSAAGARAAQVGANAS
ncbi:hotdog fold domain-containing protein [Dermacoccaceae bacterium W4C1]